ncbi:helix-turn-helix domain-containing protein [Selenomonas sp. AB3002]|uniref:helix-turn-helix domain-containing protein n=1 Tax=Selenomonas sp. AB3002 TaxID=1392502 RepID=UPI00163AE148
MEAVIMAHPSKIQQTLNTIVKTLELTFSGKLMQLIAQKGIKPAEVYTKAGITKAHFSKIKKKNDYRPRKETALALALALKLTIDETNDLLYRAGYILSRSIAEDMIIASYIKDGKHDVDEINIILYTNGAKPLTNRLSA